MIAKKTLTTDLNLFLIVVATLIVTGLLFVYSASSVYALETFNTSSYFVRKQMIGLVLGLFGLCAMQLISPATLKRLSPYLFFGSLILTALTLLPSFSHRIHGSSRWLHFPGITFQPSELLKITLILYLAYRITKQQQKLSFIRGYLPIIAILIIPSLILLKQPDFGLTVTLFATVLIMLGIAQFDLKHIMMTLFSLVPIVTALVMLYPYRLQRVLTFLNPWNDPQGTGFQIIQSLIAVGSGGLSGAGISNSKQKFFYLPMQHTDFIFSIIAEETGFLGGLFLITLYLLFLYFGIKIARQINDDFSQLVVIGFVLLINLQALINLAVATGLLPTKGIGLPLISYGNTSLVSYLLMIGIIISIVREQRNHQYAFYSSKIGYN